MTTRTRDTGGLFGVFAVRNPAGKGLGCVAAIVLLLGCWQGARWVCGPVGWADKGLYLRTGWDAIVDPPLRAIPVLKLGGNEQYPVIVERAPGWPLYTNEAHRAGRPWTVQSSQVPAKLLHEYLSIYVYRANFWRQTWPLWLLWPILAVACLVCGQTWDMRRLREARQKGVHLRGNRLVDLREWNSRSNGGTE